MTVLEQTNKQGDRIICDTDVDSFLHERSLPFFVNKAVETLLEHGADVGDTSKTENIFNALRYLVASLESDYEHERHDWENNEVLLYIKNKL